MGKDAKGRKYSQASIPGTGVYRRDYYKSSNLTSPARTQRTFSWTPATVIVVGLIGLALSFFFHC
jgi:hypothetical protein